MDSAGLSSSESINIYINTSPGEPNVVLSPDPIFANLDLEAQASASLDIDGDTVTYLYEWWVDGIAHSSVSSIIPASELNNGEVWTVRVTPNDGYSNGPYTEASITISNSPPTFLTEAYILPSTAYMNDTVTCNAIAEDVDDGTLLVSYEWNNANGDILSTSDTYQIIDTELTVNETLTCTATSSDAQGITITSTTSLNLSNTPPTVQPPEITSSGPFFVDSMLECTTTADDPDQSLTIDYHWELNGSVLSTTDTIELSGHSVLAGDEIECVATTTDDEGEIATASSSVVICYRTDCDQNLAIGSGMD